MTGWGQGSQMWVGVWRPQLQANVGHGLCSIAWSSAVPASSTSVRACAGLIICHEQALLHGTRHVV
jgi:hypothetical protein